MKKLFAQIILIVIVIGLVGLLIYELYVVPLTKIEGLDKWYEYLLVFAILTIFYAIIWMIIKGVMKLIDWASDNAA